MSTATDVSATSSGPLDEAEFPGRLTATVVEPSTPARVHGYDVESDLARHASIADQVILSLTGALPSADAARAFEVASAFLMAVPIHEAPTHAAMLTRLCGNPPASVLGVAAVALAERSRVVVADHAEWLAWLSGDRTSSAPARYLTNGLEDVAAVARLREALPDAFARDVLALSPTRDAALLGVFFEVGLREVAQIVLALCLAALPATFAEAMGVRPGKFRAYAMNTPSMTYEEGNDER